MPVIEQEAESSEQYQSEMQEIISAPPPWLVQWGLTLFFAVLLMLVGVAAMIRYPDIVTTQLKIRAVNPPRAIVPKISGKLTRILVAENEYVHKDQPLAYIESTANHEQILKMLAQLRRLQNLSFKNKDVSLQFLDNWRTFELGELQASYHSFYQASANYRASKSEGLYFKKRTYLEKELQEILGQRKYLLSQRSLQEKTSGTARKEYDIESALINVNMNYSAKQKELFELNNQIIEVKSIFQQSLNQQISEIENWKSRYILSASNSGRIAYAGILQENEYVNSNQELFYINPGNTGFFGEIHIPQYSIAKVKKGQEVLIKLRSFPYEEYGIIRGTIVYIADMPLKDSIFISRVNLNLKNSTIKKPISLKTGLTADAEIVTQESSLLRRLFRNVIKIIE